MGDVRWLSLVNRDPVPWLLDPSNPSVRLLALRDIFRRSPDVLADEQARVLKWAPVRDLMRRWERENHWGRSDNPYFGGAMGTFGTLYLLYQLGVPAGPEISAACENLLQQGRDSEGRFAPTSQTQAPWLCYTGMALQLLHHFGFGDDWRIRTAVRALVDLVMSPEPLLECPMVGGLCAEGSVKALGALLSVAEVQRTPAVMDAIAVLCEQLVDRAYDFAGRDARWLKTVFPRYYNSDLIELCRSLAMVLGEKDARLEALADTLLSLQTNEGRWCKTEATPVLNVERIQQPSRWLTFEAIHALMLIFGDDVYAA